MTPVPDSTPRVDEQLSAWLDDELPAGELALLATRLSQAPELRARLAGYALIGSRLRAGQTGNLAGELLALRLGERVQAALEGAPEPAWPAEARRPGRWLPYGIAAAAALLVVALVPLARIADFSPPSSRQSAESSVLPAAVLPVSVIPVSRSSNRMTSYLVYHGEYSGMLSAKVTDSNIINRHSSAAASPQASGDSAR